MSAPLFFCNITGSISQQSNRVNKSYKFLGFCNLLVDLGLLEKVHLYFLFPNHAKCEIRCLILGVVSFLLMFQKSLGLCDTAFGQQVQAMKKIDVICIDQIAWAIDAIKGQSAFIVHPKVLKMTEAVFKRFRDVSVQSAVSTCPSGLSSQPFHTSLSKVTTASSRSSSLFLRRGRQCGRANSAENRRAPLSS